MKPTPKFPQVIVHLKRKTDRNPLAILGRTITSMRRAKILSAEIQQYQDQCELGDDLVCVLHATRATVTVQHEEQ